MTPLLDAKGAGALLNVPASWIAEQARQGRIPHVRLGRYVRFDSDELEAWWRGRAQGPGTGTHPVPQRLSAPVNAGDLASSRAVVPRVVPMGRSEAA